MLILQKRGTLKYIFLLSYVYFKAVFKKSFSFFMLYCKIHCVLKCFSNLPVCLHSKHNFSKWGIILNYRDKFTKCLKQKRAILTSFVFINHSNIKLNINVLCVLSCKVESAALVLPAKPPRNEHFFF